jgi:E3 ubiquitin-protein ligase HUWE1
MISLFDAQELELLIAGLPNIDIEDLRSQTSYVGYEANESTILLLWDVLRDFSSEEKALFVQFVTGSSKLPAESGNYISFFILFQFHFLFSFII